MKGNVTSLKFNKPILLVYSAVSIILIVVFCIYFSRITVFEDVEVRITNYAGNSELIFVTPLNKELKIDKDKSGAWNTQNLYARKIYLKFHCDSININEIHLFLNNKQIPLNPSLVSSISNTFFIAIPYTSQRGFSKKLSYIFTSNFSGVNKTFSIPLFFLLTVILFGFMLFIALNKRSKIYLIGEAKKLFYLKNFVTLFHITVFQVSMFFALWLIVILITIYAH